MPVKSVPSREELVAIIEASGSADTDFFGYPHKDDGLYLQQDPEEFAAFVHFVATKIKSAELTLDIGVAAGGQTKFLRDYFDAKKTIVVDIGQHYQFGQWERIKKTVNSEIILEIIGDSHSPETRQKLLPFVDQIDFAFVDGDHSYRGLRKDIFLTRELLRNGGYMVLHDTAAFGDCVDVFQDLLRSKHFVLVRNFQNRLGISVWKHVRKPRTSRWLERQFGFGKL